MKRDTAAELAEVRAVVAKEHDGAVPASLRTVDLVRALVKVAQREHGKLETIRRKVLELGFPNTGSVVTLVTGALGELALCREALERGQMHAINIETDEDKARVLALFEQALGDGKLTLSAGAAAGLREAMTGDSGAIEIALTEHEITDLVLSGVAFTEVGGSGGPDVLVKLADTTGWLRRLQALIHQRDADRAVKGPEGQIGQQRPDRATVGEIVDVLPLSHRSDDEDEGGGSTAK